MADREITNERGQVKWFDPRKGYGFIVGPQGQDIFVHYSVIESEGFRALKDGATVNYDASLGDKGWAAKRVVKEEGSGDGGEHTMGTNGDTRRTERKSSGVVQ